jgi:hypothetical protein
MEDRTMTTYTVISSSSGLAKNTGLSNVEAAQAVLSHDGQEYELRQADAGWWQLYIGRRSGGLVAAWCNNDLLLVAAPTEGEAWDNIAALVIHHNWPNHPDVITDAEYAQSQVSL